MTTTHLRPGKSLQVTAPVGGVTTSLGARVGQIFGVAKTTESAGDTAVLDVEECFTLTKETPLVISQGDEVFWDDTNSRVDKTNTNYPIGVAMEDAASGATTVKVRLDGRAGTLRESDTGGGSGNAGKIAVLDSSGKLDGHDIGTEMAAMQAENTDGEFPIKLGGGDPDGGTWAHAISSGGLVTVTRTAAAGPESYWVEIGIPNRTSSGKGIKPTGLKVAFSIATEAADDVRFEVWKGTYAGPPTAAVLFGDADADYEAAYDTAAERGAIGEHTVTLTDAGTPAFLAAGEFLLLRCYIDDTTGNNSVLVVKHACLLYTDLVVDAA